VQVTRDGGKTWTNVVKNIQGLAPNAWIPTVEAGHYDAGTAYVAADHHQDNDYTAYFFKTTDYGKTWTRLSLSEPPAKTGWSHVIREDPKVKSILYAGTELGLWVSFDGGSRWTSLRQNMPPVPVRDIQIHPRDNDLLVATHGRGLYILDDITPLQHVHDAIRTETELFDLRPATRWTIWNKDGNLGQGVWKAPNPPTGAIIDYYLKSDQKDPVTITIADKSGKTIRTMTNAPKTAGVNRFVWDLRYDGPRPSQSAAGGRRGGDLDPEIVARFIGAGAPTVVPGEYVVKLHAAGKDMTKPLVVDLDPRVQATPADLTAQLEAGLQLRDLMSRANETVDRANELIQQLTSLQDRLKKTTTARPTSQNEGHGGEGVQAPTGDLAAMVKRALDAVTKLRDDDLTRPYPSMGYRQYPRIREEIQSLAGAVNRPAARPTDGQALRMKELGQELEQASAALSQIQSDQIAKINAAMKNLPFISVQ